MRPLPIRPVDDLLVRGPLLILAPHPDDESLGCGGVIAACCARGAPPFVLVVTDGAGSHPNSLTYPPARLAALRADEARAAGAALGLPADRTRVPEPAGYAKPARRARRSRPPASRSARWSGATASAPSWPVGSTIRIATIYRRIGSRRTPRRRPGCCTGPIRSGAGPWARDTMLPAIPGGLRVDIAAHLPAKRLAIAAHRSQYAGLIVDDPRGFQLPPDFLALSTDITRRSWTRSAGRLCRAAPYAWTAAPCPPHPGAGRRARAGRRPFRLANRSRRPGPRECRVLARPCRPERRPAAAQRSRVCWRRCRRTNRSVTGSSASSSSVSGDTSRRRIVSAIPPSARPRMRPETTTCTSGACRMRASARRKAAGEGPVLAQRSIRDPADGTEICRA